MVLGLKGAVAEREGPAAIAPIVETRSQAPVAVINSRMAQRLWPDENSIGQRFRPLSSQTWFTVVGVSESILNWDISDRPQPTAYVPIGHVPESEPRIFLRAAGDPLLAAQPARAAIHEASPQSTTLRLCLPRFVMDCRVKPGNDRVDESRPGMTPRVGR